MKKYTIEEIKEKGIAVLCKSDHEAELIIGESITICANFKFAVWGKNSKSWDLCHYLTINKQHIPTINFDQVDFGDEEKTYGKPVSMEQFAEVKRQSEKQTTEQKLREIADRLNGGKEIGHLDEYIYYIKCQMRECFLEQVKDIYSFKIQGVIYCYDISFLETAIKEIGEDILKRDLFGIQPEKEYTLKELILDDTIEVGTRFELSNWILSKGSVSVNIIEPKRKESKLTYKEVYELESEKVTIIEEV